MELDELVRSGRVRRESVSRAEIEQVMKLADRDLKLARKILRDDTD